MEYSGKWIDDLNLELNGSDRACAVLAGAIVDDRLKGLLQKYLLPSKSAKEDKLLGRSSPIESLSSRIELAYRLGLIGEEMSSSLHWIRDIRNLAAHEESFSISEQSCRDKIRNVIQSLKIDKNAPKLLQAPYDSNRGMFIAAIIMIAIAIDLETVNIEQTINVPVNAILNAEFTG
jgi:DNA-binding MltR family transcriptional regulator